MYSLVLSYLSPIQKGIQMAHSINELERQIGNSDEYKKWSDVDKTIIMLEGGDVNELEKELLVLEESGMTRGVFREPSLGGIITSVSVLVDERVFDTNKYPNYDVYLSNNNILGMSVGYNIIFPDSAYKNWLELIGGKDNERLRNLLNGKRLAR